MSLPVSCVYTLWESWQIMAQESLVLDTYKRAQSGQFFTNSCHIFLKKPAFLGSPISVLGDTEAHCVKIESRDIPLSDIHETHLLLRFVEKDSLEYMELRDSIAATGR